MTTPPSQSVFDALAAGSSKGSWADRIKSVDNPTVPLPTVNGPSSGKSTPPAQQSQSQPQAESQTQTLPQSHSKAQPPPQQKITEQDDGEWQQVASKPTGRRQGAQGSSSQWSDAKQQGQSQGSASRDWRDRTDKGDDTADKKGKAAKRTGGKKSSAEQPSAVAEKKDVEPESSVPPVNAEAEAPAGPAAAPSPAPIAKIAAPTVNPWAARREKMQSAPASNVNPTAPASAKVNGSTKKPPAVKANGAAETSASKGATSAKKVGKGQAPPPVTDEGSWPDVAKAAEALKTADKEKERRIKADEASVAEAARAQAGKKHKWMAIPALELQAAADKAAENARRQAKADQPRKKTSRNDGGDGESSPSRPNTRPSSRKPSFSSPSKGKSGIRLPAPPGGSKKSAKDAIKPVFGTVSPTPTSEFSDAEGANGRRMSGSKSSVAGSALGLDNVVADRAGEIGGSTLSRQVSRHSREPSSPRLEGTTVEREATEDTKATKGLNTNGANFAPAGRGGRGGGRGFGGRGRGGYRNGHITTGPRGAYTSPNYASGQLPVEGAYGQDYAYGYGYGASAYGYGMPYPSMQIGGRTMPPPPMPVTQVPGLDFLRVCLLGQVEYYFGMQNLAMDFFLRQQMDSEGWIDISMISSFNRVKSLTPDISIVREMMLLSSILEVKDDSVRLAGGEARRWVLPDARISTIKSDNDDSTIENGGEAVLGVPDDMPQDRWSTLPNGGVESALLKSVPVSSAVSVDDSDPHGKDTPATSMSGDHGDDREEMEMKTISAAVDALTAQQ